MSFALIIACLLVLAGTIAISSAALAFALHRQIARRVITLANIAMALSETKPIDYGRATTWTAELDALAYLIESRQLNVLDGAALLRTLITSMPARSRMLPREFATSGFPRQKEKRMGFL